MKTIDKIITKVDTRRGAPMGRRLKGPGLNPAKYSTARYLCLGMGPMTAAALIGASVHSYAYPIRKI